ncbi:hypothetical protein [Aquimarina mytili]|uniref:Glycerophosphoryl diester phosphodiesterase membrane domain-containing protein n=1 Tax=Aquimarina mytili TaxID=874423 RepID=A0A937DA46_9FLAO|nr:hypothetical protein [Aquimarina mytili]MBL0684372.1 hypothetical protein [Aquimarina mytili]
MKNNYIELKQTRELGEIISTYFDFFKQNLKSFTNTFISYNGIFILLLLGVSYLLVTGFVGLYDSNTNTGLFGDTTTREDSFMFIGIGFFLFFIVFMIIAALNYSLASGYMITYEKQKKIIEDRRDVWSFVKENFGRIFIFILLLLVIYTGFLITSVILAFIPILGTLVQYVIQFWVTSWLGVSFMVMLYEGKSPIDALGEGWDLVKSNFWKCVGANFILGLLIGLLLLLVLVIPSVIVGVYTYHMVDTGADIANSAVAKIIYTISLCIFLIIMAYSQSLSQFVNGILYFSLHEQKYNVNTREKIDQIGASE